MTTLNKDFDQIDEAALQFLVDTQTPEGYRLEYKGEISNIISLVEGLVAFANTQGGDLFIGIPENAGVPLAINGLELDDPDALILRYSQALLNNTDPQIMQARFRAIQLANGRYVIAVRVPRSWNGPHRVTQNHKFLIRTSAGKFPVGTAELRRLFGSRESFLTQYERFRFQRIEKTINTYRMPTPFSMVHFVPVSAFDLEANYPLVEQRTQINHAIMGGGGSNPGVNAQGLFYRLLENQSGGHTQFFRNGIVEQVSNYAFNNLSGQLGERKDFISTKLFEQHIKESVRTQIRNFEQLGVTDPFYLFVNLVGATGLAGSINGPNYGPPQRIDDELLQIPEILIEKFDKEAIDLAIESIMTVMWNAFGFTERPKNHH
ncbi:AlbA family DNA-binding domain-containing protein [Paenibacillus sp. MMO-58]|uniref:AlbA family DNA-binding domain-containing protein n=1 Tax=Paenibacillus sp. MMO-58 TaxID=3081290 RepID=UPI0030197A91